jgi:hypothetical protein
MNKILTYTLCLISQFIYKNYNNLIEAKNNDSLKNKVKSFLFKLIFIFQLLIYAIL